MRRGAVNVMVIKYFVITVSRCCPCDCIYLLIVLNAIYVLLFRVMIKVNGQVDLNLIMSIVIVLVIFRVQQSDVVKLFMS